METIEHNGTSGVFATAAELEEIKAAAKAGMLAESEAQRRIDSAAANARREAEAKLDPLNAKIKEYETIGATLVETQAKLTAAETETANHKRMLDGIKALVSKGAQVKAAEFLVKHSDLAQADFSTDDGINKAVEIVKAILPGAFETPQVHVAGGGSPNQTTDPGIDERIAQAQKAGNALLVIQLTNEKFLGKK